MKRVLLITSLAGFLAGVCNALLGTGGGIFLITALSLVGCDTRASFATANGVILFLSLISFFLYIKEGIITQNTFSSFFPWKGLLSAAGGGAGAFLLTRISPELLQKLFCLMLLFCGVKLCL